SSRPLIFSRSRQSRKREPALFHAAGHGGKGVVQRRTDGFHSSHDRKCNAARNDRVFDSGGAALTFQKTAQHLHRRPLIHTLLASFILQHNGGRQRRPSSSPTPWQQDMNFGFAL